jgi:hypothetical protein
VKRTGKAILSLTAGKKVVSAIKAVKAMGVV